MSSRTKQIIRATVGLTLAVALIGWGFPKFAKTNWTEVWIRVEAVSAWQALGFLGLVLVGLGCCTFTFTGSLPGLSHWRAFIVNICGSCVSNLLPGGGAVGLAATYTILRSWGFKNRDVSTSAIVTGVWNTLARIALPVVAIIMLWVGNDGLRTSLTSAAFAAAASGLAIFSIFLAILASEKAAQTIGRGLDKVLAPLFRRRKRTMSIDALVHDMRGRMNEVVRTGWMQMTFGMIGFSGSTTCCSSSSCTPWGCTNRSGSCSPRSPSGDSLQLLASRPAESASPSWCPWEHWSHGVPTRLPREQASSCSRSSPESHWV